MLDQDSVLEPELTGKAVNVAGAIRHLSQDDLESYAGGRLASARLSYCQTHLDSCEACRAELEDIRTLQTELASFPRREANRHEPGRGGRRRSLAVPVTASVGIVLVAGVAAVWWWRHAGPRTSNTVTAARVAPAPVVASAAPDAPSPPAATTRQVAAVPAAASAPRAAPPSSVTPTRVALASRAPASSAPAATVTPVASTPRAALAAPPARDLSAAPTTRVALVQPAASVPRGAASIPVPAVTATPTSVPRTPSAPTAAASVQTHGTQLAEEIAALPVDLRLGVSEAIQQGKLQLPADVQRVHDRAVAPSLPAAANTGFSLSGPFGEATFETRPKFTWQPLAGAIGYTVAIVDQGLRPVQHSPGLRATTWRPRRALAHGRTYLWQVTATLRGGSKVVASSPSPSEATLRILPRKLADEIAHFQRGHRDAHLVLGVLYAQAGMVTEGAGELRQVPPGDSSYNIARRLVESLSSRSGMTAGR
jgi:hypothetical protein